MALIGVRELRQQTTEVLRRVREERAEYIVTYQGRPVALLLPVDTGTVEAAMVEAGKRSVAGGWEVYARAMEQARRDWPKGRKAQEALDEVRE